jgi:hypothetical protein
LNTTDGSDTTVSETTDPVETAQVTESSTETSTTEPTTQDTANDQTAQAGQADQKGQSEDSFFDPTQVPEELQPVYKGMQAAYTKKTQEVATLRKEAEGWKTKAESYDKYERYIPIVEEMLSSDKAETKQGPEIVALETELRKQGYSDEAINMMKIGAQTILNQFNQSRQTEKEQEVLEKGIAEAEQVDPRLNDESLVYKTDDGKTVTFGEMVSKLVFSDPNWQKHPVEATRAAIKNIDALIGQAKTQGKQELSDQAKVKAGKFPSVTSSPQSAAGDSQPKTVHEAAAEAKKELGL